MKPLLALGVVIAGLTLASTTYADETTATTPSTSAPQHQHGPFGGEGGPLGKAIHQAMKSCKTAGVDFKTCAQQLTTYLADFKPSK